MLIRLMNRQDIDRVCMFIIYSNNFTAFDKKHIATNQANDMMRSV